MFTKLFNSSWLIIIPLIFFSCQKSSDPIAGFTEDDTSGHIGPVVRKPNIYLYPTKKIDLTVQLKFPHGGKILESCPDYRNGWNIKVEPSGLIDDEYWFLFYEARISEMLQKNNGWIIPGENLQDFFTRNLAALRFSDREISDFLEYWIPQFEMNKTYAIYPHYVQELSDIIELDFSILPDNIIRVLYLIEEYNGNSNIELPQVPAYKREGFTVLEWGVVYQ